MLGSFIIEELKHHKDPQLLTQEQVISAIKRGRRRGLAIMKSETPLTDTVITNILKDMFKIESVKDFNNLNAPENNNPKQMKLNEYILEYIQHDSKYENIDFCFTYTTFFQPNNSVERKTEYKKLYYWLTFDKRYDVIYFRFKRKEKRKGEVIINFPTETTTLTKFFNSLEKYIKIKPLPFNYGIYKIYRDVVSEAEKQVTKEIQQYKLYADHYQQNLIEAGFFEIGTSIAKENYERLIDLQERIAIEKNNLIFNYTTDKLIVHLKSLIYKDAFSGVNASEDIEKDNTDKSEDDFNTRIFLDIRKSLNKNESLQEILLRGAFQHKEKKDIASIISSNIRLINRKEYLIINFNSIHLTKKIEQIAFNYFKTHFPELNLNHCI